MSVVNVDKLIVYLVFAKVYNKIKMSKELIKTFAFPIHVHYTLVQVYIISSIFVVCMDELVVYYKAAIIH